MLKKSAGIPVYRMFLLALWAGLSLGCTSMKTPLSTVANVDLPRYMGDWYVIANIPYFAEKNCYDSIESYALRPDGNIDNWFRCRKGSFAAPLERKASALVKVVDKSSNAVWSVKFFKIISVQYLILALDPNYQWVVVGHPSRRYGWIMARTKSMDPALYQRLLGDLAAQGYDPGKFEKVPQNQTEVGAAPAGAAATN